MKKSNSKDSKKDTPICESPNNRYVCFNDVLGTGSFKIVYRAYDRQNGIEVAWNSIKIDKLDEKYRQFIIDEVMLLKELSKKNKYIIDFQNAWLEEERSTIVFITGLALSGTLKDYIIKMSDNINLRVIKKWGKQILKGLEFLHDQNIAHRDIKCNNIFYNSNTGNIIIGDLGLAKQKVENFTTMIGTPEYMAPEMYEDNGYSEKIDIYAFGMCLLEMITGDVPYCECKGVGHIYKNVVDNVKPLSLDKVKNTHAKNIIERCIEKDPNIRPAASELLAEEFFTFFEEEDNDLKLTKTPNKTDLETSDIQNEEMSNNVERNTLKEIEDLESNENHTHTTKSIELAIKEIQEEEDVSEVAEKPPSDPEKAKCVTIHDFMMLNLKRFTEEASNPNINQTISTTTKNIPVLDTGTPTNSLINSSANSLESPISLSEELGNVHTPIEQIMKEVHILSNSKVTYITEGEFCSPERIEPLITFEEDEETNDIVDIVE